MLLAIPRFFLVSVFSFPFSVWSSLPFQLYYVVSLLPSPPVFIYLTFPPVWISLNLPSPLFQVILTLQCHPAWGWFIFPWHTRCFCLALLICLYPLKGCLLLTWWWSRVGQWEHCLRTANSRLRIGLEVRRSHLFITHWQALMCISLCYWDNRNSVVGSRRNHRPILKRLGKLLLQPYSFLGTVFFLLNNERWKL